MSIATRKWVCDSFGQIDASQRNDLMDPHLTNTVLIAFLQELFVERNGIWRGKLACTSVRSDHPTADGTHGHQGGNAIDFKEITMGAPQHLVKDLQACEDARGIGLGGQYQSVAAACGGYSPQSKLFQDNVQTHIHVQVLNY